MYGRLLVEECIAKIVKKLGRFGHFTVHTKNLWFLGLLVTIQVSFTAEYYIVKFSVSIINRPGVARAVLQSPPSLID